MANGVCCGIKTGIDNIRQKLYTLLGFGDYCTQNEQLLHLVFLTDRVCAERDVDVAAGAFSFFLKAVFSLPRLFIKSAFRAEKRKGVPKTGLAKPDAAIKFEQLVVIGDECNERNDAPLEMVLRRT